MLVRALEPCFIDGQRRRKGAEFEYDGDKLPAHLVPAQSAVTEKPVVVAPVALSELAMVESKPKSFIEATKSKTKTGPDKA